MKIGTRFVCLGLVTLLSACGSSSNSTPDGGGGPNASTPPMGATAIEAWLAEGSYKQWHCEPALHEARSPSPHGFNRICSNDTVAGAATGGVASGRCGGQGIACGRQFTDARRVRRLSEDQGGQRRGSQLVLVRARPSESPRASRRQRSCGRRHGLRRHAAIDLRRVSRSGRFGRRPHTDGGRSRPDLYRRPLGSDTRGALECTRRFMDWWPQSTRGTRRADLVLG